MLVLRLTSSSDANKESFVITESTGTYDVITNDTGWGTPNVDLTNIVSSELKITNNTNNTVYDTIPYIHSNVVGNSFIINYSSLSINSVPINIKVIQDGIYCFEIITVMDDNSILNRTLKYLTLYNLECKIKKLSLEAIDMIDSCCDDCGQSEKLKALSKAFVLYKLIRNAFQCGNIDIANKLINHLTLLLESLSCKNC